MKKNEIKAKTDELIKNLTQTNNKESKKVNGKNTKLIEILQKKLDKIKRHFTTNFKPYVIGKITKNFKDKVKLNGSVNWI